MSDALLRLAEAAGVPPRWLDVYGTWHDVAPDTLHAVLRSLGYATETDDDIADSTVAVRAAAGRLPPLVTATVGESLRLPTTGRWKLVLEGGGTQEGVAEGGQLPGFIQTGYHRLELDNYATTLAIAPRRAYGMQDRLEGRTAPWALAVQLYGLRRAGDAGLGDFQALTELVPSAARLGASGIAISPVHAQFSADLNRFSPYSPSSRVALNVLHSGVGVPRTALSAGLEAAAEVDWPESGRLRLDALRAEFEAAGEGELAEFARFRAENGSTLEAHARFEAIHARIFGADPTKWHWRDWPRELQSPASPAVHAFAETHRHDVTLHAYMQFRADRSLAAAQKACREAGMSIGLIADLAVGADSGGSHCWSHPAETLPGMTVGAPPDLLNTQGQGWGLIAFSPRGLRDNGYGAFLQMLRHAMRHAGGVRIDHALGLARLWIIPDGGSPRDGAYVSFPVDDLLRLIALESTRHCAVVLGEDLGTIPEGFQDKLGQAGVMGMRVLWFEEKARPVHGPARLEPHGGRDDQHARPADGRGLVERARPRMAPPPAPGRGAGPRNAGHREAHPGADGAVVRPAAQPGRRGPRAAAGQPRTGGGRRRAPPCHRGLRADDPAPGGRARPVRAAEPAGHHDAASELAAALPRRRGHAARSARGGRAAATLERQDPPVKPLSATVRLQFHKGFTLGDAERLVPYFDRLGVSHIYASPLLKARPGSTHGYDIVDHNRVNDELGGEDALVSLVARLRGHGMGLILDIVPNHMGVGGADNAWWLDVLEWGRASPYAEYFDIDWDPPDATLRGRLLMPFLGKPYGQCLADGDLVLRFDDADGRLFVAYAEHRFPVNPRDYAAVLLTESGPLEEPARMFAELGAEGRAAARTRAVEARGELLQPVHARAVAEAVAAYHPRTEAGRERLHRLLERQAYRLSWWRAATDEINWRRFFDVNSLAGVRVELPGVFEDTHRTVFRLYEQGLIDGVRIDHVDGLAYPREYCRKLRRRLDALTEHRPPDLRERPVLWVEKILFAHEHLATDWMTDGTTGYDFMNDAGAILHDPAGEEPMTALWTGLTGRPAAFEDEAMAARRQILRENLSSELFSVAQSFQRVARRSLVTRDYTLTGIRTALVELLVHFRTYRIYAGPAGISAPDTKVLDWALAGARRTVRVADQAVLELLGQWVAGTGLRGAAVGTQRQEWLRAMVKFQQLSAPTAAKSVEDTAFYRYGRLLSRNEVGSEPSQWSITPAALHAANKDRQKRFPRALLATATHDHKRGEDTRARLAVLSEIPEEWEAATHRWMRLNAPHHRDLDGPAPDAADELMIYETVVSAWPLDLRPDDAGGLDAYRTRLSGWLEKSLREAKRRTGWTAPDMEYEDAARGLLAACLDPSRAVGAEMAAFAARIAVPGAVNGLSQALLRLTCPGVPDLYQGTEFWDLSLVDPDNRRPVDFAAREAALAAGVDGDTLLRRWQDGHIKQRVVHGALAFRTRAPRLFEGGSYVPLIVEGPRSDHVFAFARVHEGRAALVAVTRLPAKLGLMADNPAVSADAWGETILVAPRHMVGRDARCALGYGWDGPLPARIGAGALLGQLPVALLEV